MFSNWRSCTFPRNASKNMVKKGKKKKHNTKKPRITTTTTTTTTKIQQHLKVQLCLFPAWRSQKVSGLMQWTSRCVRECSARVIRFLPSTSLTLFFCLFVFLPASLLCVFVCGCCCCCCCCRRCCCCCRRGCRCCCRC